VPKADNGRTKKDKERQAEDNRGNKGQRTEGFAWTDAGGGLKGRGPKGVGQTGGGMKGRGRNRWRTDMTGGGRTRQVEDRQDRQVQDTSRRHVLVKKH
jgi:hypothetical protein